jgi:hypothetical protein
MSGMDPTAGTKVETDDDRPPWIVEVLVGTVIGVAALLRSLAPDATETAVPGGAGAEGTGSEGHRPGPADLPPVAGAAAVVATDLASGAARLTGSVLEIAGRAIGPRLEPLRPVVERIDARWAPRSADAVRVAERAWTDLLNRSVDAVTRRIDIEAEVRRNVDLTALVSSIDLDAVIARIDLDAVIERIDLDAVIARIDLTELARAVIEELDVPELIRGSAGSMTGEAVEEVRMGTARADRAVSRAIERLLRRDGDQNGSHPAERAPEQGSADHAGR